MNEHPLARPRATTASRHERTPRRNAVERPGLTGHDARDLLFTYNSPETYDLLVNHRRWSPDKYGAWIADSLTAALLR